MIGNEAARQYVGVRTKHITNSWRHSFPILAWTTTKVKNSKRFRIVVVPSLKRPGEFSCPRRESTKLPSLAIISSPTVRARNLHTKTTHWPFEGTKRVQACQTELLIIKVIRNRGSH
jgi:hypothetical protein